jgi:hypothetical protein
VAATLSAFNTHTGSVPVVIEPTQVIAAPSSAGAAMTVPTPEPTIISETIGPIVQPATVEAPAAVTGAVTAPPAYSAPTAPVKPTSDFHTKLNELSGRLQTGAGFDVPAPIKPSVGTNVQTTPLLEPKPATPPTLKPITFIPAPTANPLPLSEPGISPTKHTSLESRPTTLTSTDSPAIAGIQITAQEKTTMSPALSVITPGAAVTVPEITTPAAPAPIRTDVPLPKKAPEQSVESILKSVQLPERREAHMIGDAPVAAAQVAPSFATGIGIAQTISDAAITLAQTAEHTAPAQKTDEDGSKTLYATRTLKEDMKQLVHERNVSLVTAVALESDKARGQEAVLTKVVADRARTSHLLNTIIAIMFFLVVGVFAAGAVFFVSQKRVQTTTAQNYSQDLMFVEDQLAVAVDNLSARDVKRRLQGAQEQAGITLGGIHRLIPVTGPDDALQQVDLAGFNTLAGLQMPEALLRSLSGEYLLGTHATGDSNAPLLVLVVSNFEQSFSSMLIWEPLMRETLTPTFNTTAQSLQQPDGTITPNTFKDVVIKNYDVRAILDEKNNIRLMYAFPSRTILIISQSEDSFIEAVTRLKAAQVL